MKKILNSIQMKELENNTIENIGIDGVVLMERAAYEVSKEIMASFDINKSILIACGTGNNGADGLCVARYLIEKGYKPHVFINFGHSQTDLFIKQKKILDNLKCDFVDSIEFHDIFVDALLGIGIKGNIDDNTLNIINKINSYHSYVISLDIPSGLDASSGLSMPEAIKTNVTYTFGAYKSGLFYKDAVNYTGKVVLKDIGIFDADLPFEAYMLEENDISILNEIRINNSNKSTYGKVLTVAGSKKMCGCAILSSLASLKCGSGMVKIITHKNNLNAIMNSLPEAMLELYDDTNSISENDFKDACEWSDVIVCGPGIGTDSTAQMLTLYALNTNKSVILDADALNCLSINSFCQERIKNRLPYTTIITPHKGESKRLLEAFKVDTLEELSDLLKIIIVDKDAKTKIIGRENYINNSGNNGMSTAGCGDVLSGIIASITGFYEKGLLNCSIERATALAVFLHGAAADYAVNESKESGLIASEIADNIPSYLFNIDNK